MQVCAAADVETFGTNILKYDAALLACCLYQRRKCLEVTLPSADRISEKQQHDIPISYGPCQM